jgi:hypothetical protein
MASVLKVDKLDPQSGTALEIGTSGDTVTVPSGVGLTLTDSTLLLPTTITSTTEVKTNKISPATGAAFALGDSGDTFTVPSGATIVNSGTATGFGITAASFRPNVNPLWINGNMAVSQRATSATGKTAGGFYTVDRMQLDISGTIGTWTVAQESLTSGNAFDNGFANAYRIDCTSATASPAAAAFLKVISSFEGQDLQVFKKGTSNAEKWTLGFWVKSNRTGTTQVNLRDMDNTRMIGASYTISVADTWEYKVCNFAADTTGDFDDDNARSLIVEWWLDGGSDYTSGAMPTAWEARSAADSMAAGSLDMAGSTDNDFAITGIQLEVGEYTSSTIPPFQHESYGENLKRCGRYYEKLTANNNYADFSHQMITTSTTAAWGAWFYSYPKRAVPTLGISDVADFAVMKPQGGRDVISAFTLDPHSMMIGTDAMNTRFYVTTTNTIVGEGGFLCANNTGSGYLSWDAEL